ncbi:hypothetical protein ILUMI_19300 [Ignelater luminosus]|uniref:Uncharacterized protein n=1 Tax=Ignelater luminosus TaxID=2038154 RepID=A0A8K0G3C6_IGNLU|nr:hypothetical protein ILUMI_19300 [Ignelater luminosus]
MSQRNSVKHFSVPRNTIRFRISDKFHDKTSHGTSPILSFDEEKLLKKAVDDLKSDSIINGFRASRLYLRDPSAIDFSKCVGKVSDEPSAKNETVSDEATITYRSFERKQSEKLSFVLTSLPRKNSEKLEIDQQLEKEKLKEEKKQKRIQNQNEKPTQKEKQIKVKKLLAKKKDLTHAENSLRDDIFKESMGGEDKIQSTILKCGLKVHLPQTKMNMWDKNWNKGNEDNVSRDLNVNSLTTPEIGTNGTEIKSTPL